jgi:four helix bundle protein
MERPFDIQERTYLFAKEVVLFCRALNGAHSVTRFISWQLLKAATSVGANMEEADAGQSKADFISKVAIARKEGRETAFWLRLIAETDPGMATKLAGLRDESDQIIAILTTIRRNAGGQP